MSRRSDRSTWRSSCPCSSTWRYERTWTFSCSISWRPREGRYRFQWVRRRRRSPFPKEKSTLSDCNHRSLNRALVLAHGTCPREDQPWHLLRSRSSCCHFAIQARPMGLATAHRSWRSRYRANLADFPFEIKFDLINYKLCSIQILITTNFSLLFFKSDNLTWKLNKRK